MKTIEELRTSDYHVELARRLCIAFVSQQAGVSFPTAEKYVDREGTIGDVWLLVAEFAWNLWREGMESALEKAPEASVQ